MQNAALAHLGIAAAYTLWHTPAADLPARIAALRGADVLGANVTLPHKAAVIPLLDSLEAEAASIGAVNTIYKGSDGSLVGANTDAPALLEALRMEAGFSVEGQAVVLLGASGAARAAAYALLRGGVSRLVVANRTLERAEHLLADMVALQEEQTAEAVEGAVAGNGVEIAEPVLPRMVALALDDPDLGEYIAACTLLINATSLGWQAHETPLPDPSVSTATLVYDMVYRPTRLLHEAAARGARTLDGAGMLVHQGALAFTRWTGQAAPLDVMYAVLRKTH
jgi:shikimate dehydrogenase